jgi:signal transduction histidine kinase
VPNQNKRSSLTRILFIVGSLCILFAESYEHLGVSPTRARIEKAQAMLSTLDKEMKEGLERALLLADDSSLHDFNSESHRKQNGISYYVFDDGKLSAWSSNEPVLPDSLKLSAGLSGMLVLPNGEFMARAASRDKRTVIGLLLIRHAYAYENRYLKNEFNPALKLSPWLEVADTSGMPFIGPDGSAIYYLKESQLEDRLPFTITPAIYLAGIVILLLSLLSLLIRSTGFFIWSALAILIRLLMIFTGLPSELYETDLFSPRNYASSFFFNSLGDLLLNSLLTVVLATGFMVRGSGARAPAQRNFTAFTVLMLLFIAAAILIHTLFCGLVMNSRISFDVTRLSELNAYTLLAFACMALLLMSLVFILISGLRKIFVLRFSFGGIIMIILLASSYTGIVIGRQNQKKEHEARKMFAQKVSAPRDHVAEYLFADLEEKLVTDSTILSLFQRGNFNADQAAQHLSSLYFTGYLGKFDISAMGFDSYGKSLEPAKYPDSLEAYTGSILYQESAELSPGLYYQNDGSGKLSYIAIIPVRVRDGSFSLLIWMTAKFFRSDEGFPELFIGGAAGERQNPLEYSVARYQNGELIYEYGDFAYSFSSREMEKLSQGAEFVVQDNYEHLIHKTGDGNLIVVSRVQQGDKVLLTLFSWIFAFFGLFFAIKYILFRLISGIKWKALNLTRRIQVSVLLLVVSSFILIGSGTLYYIYNKYRSDQRRSISGQVNGLWFLIGKSLELQVPLSGIPEGELDQILDQLVSDLNLDFNLYDEQGQLYYSSQPKIFEQNIVSRRMNASALHAIEKRGKTQYIRPESIGSLQYIAAYSPFTDKEGRMTGILNLPYFEKQNELNREISGFLSALINVYVLLFAIAVLVTLFISSRITKPLLLIQEKLSRVRLGKRNEPINYTRKDEIGQLVQEYNRMLDELTISAEKLAQSERESAWKEMARQVAHEIKNPLTPMKLSVQHLQRAWAEGRADKEELLEKTARTIISQIDTLSNIATEFSNFARMPDAKIQKVNICEVLEQAVSLFRDTPGVEIESNAAGKSLFVMADPDQLMRAFSNLLKNAVQAIPETRRGLIQVEIQRSQDDYCTIRFSDNGNGIPENQRDKIFSPNFTTKSSGMGLGLSMVKNIVETTRGTVWFTSGYDQGASFFIRLPLAD